MGTRELTSGKRTLDLAAQALERASQNLGNPFVQAVHSISECSGKVVVSGVGKSAHVAAKIAATFNSTGTKALFLHAGEA
ncbi:MAG: D-arabinose 5-phosphate isomerase, partial [Flavobacteriales bacterium]|nr:D-arabinose 5-phosphate isomerase [Flavobacteriales bacterium]